MSVSACANLAKKGGPISNYGQITQYGKPGQGGSPSMTQLKQCNSLALRLPLEIKTLPKTSPKFGISPKLNVNP